MPEVCSAYNCKARRGDVKDGPQPRTDYLKNSFSYSGAVLWNSLPSDLRQASSLQKFKADCSNVFR